MNVEELAGAWPGAVVIIDAGTRAQMVRAAAHVFAVEGGAAWLEPSYADPFGAAVPSWHERRGTTEARGDGFRVTTDEGQTVDFVPYDAEDHADMTDDALEWFRRWLATQGRSHAQERARLKAGDA